MARDLIWYKNQFFPVPRLRIFLIINKRMTRYGALDATVDGTTAMTDCTTAITATYDSSNNGSHSSSYSGQWQLRPYPSWAQLQDPGNAPFANGSYRTAEPLYTGSPLADPGNRPFQLDVAQALEAHGLSPVDAVGRSDMIGNS